MKKGFLMGVALALSVLPVFAQNIGINADGSKPNTNAILDIKAGNKGLLIPRMDSLARKAIPNTRGLMVYDISTDNFWYNDGKKWKCIPNDDNKDKNGLAWLITGNSNTKDTVNFLGTINNVPLNIRVNNQPSGRIDPTNGNTFWGYQVGANSTGNNNTATGWEALLNNTSGYQNTANGYQALASNTSGYQNTATGTSALLSNTTGLYNTADGIAALALNTTANYNTAIGMAALQNLTSGAENTAVGASTLFAGVTMTANTAIGTGAMENAKGGDGNTALGDHTLFSNSSGSSNIAAGTGSMFNNTTGTYNTACGGSTLYNNTTGNNITVLGSFADVATDGLVNATAIGNAAIVDASNKVRIGNAAVTVIEGQVPFTTPSDGRFKFNIQEDVRGLDFILQLRPVTYQFDVRRFDAGMSRQDATTMSYAVQTAYDEATRIRRSGFIAQEVEKAAYLSGYNFSGLITPKTPQDHYSLSYDAFVVPLVKGMQEQQLLIDTQNKKLAEQDKRMAVLQQEIDELKKLIQANK